MLVDQAEQLRKMSAQLAPRARVIAVTSGKGGVGKTNIAIGYALACAAMGLRTILVDADLGLANVDVLLNLRAKYNLAHVITNRKSVDEALVPAAGGIQVLPGATGLSQLANLDNTHRDRLIQKLELLEEMADVLIIDTGAGISRNVVNFTLSADEVVLVTTPEPTAITDAYAMVKVLSGYEEVGDIKLLVNMADSRKEAQRIAAALVANCSRFLNQYVDSLGYVVRDQCVLNAVRKRSHFLLEAPSCPASACLRNVVMGSFSRHKTLQGQGGFFRRLAGFILRG